MRIQVGHIAVVTGGGNGMGRAICLELAKRGCNVATCDLSKEAYEKTLAECQALNPSGKFCGAVCDITNEEQCVAFRDAVASTLGTKHINLLFNNAGMVGGFSFLKDTRKEFERTFNVCYYGVYNMTRAFQEMLVASTEGALINTSSINGFLALPLNVAYSTAKFAVKGFTEAMITDFKMNAPHVSAHCVMPGYVGTEISKLSASQNYELRKGEKPPDGVLQRWETAPVGKGGLAHGRRSVEAGDALSPEDAGKVIVGGVEDGKFRIFVGDDAEAIDVAVRNNPEEVYKMDVSGGGPTDFTVNIAKLGDPAYFAGRNTQLERRAKAKL